MKRKKMIVFVLAVALILLLPASVFGETSSGDSTVSFTMLPPITLTAYDVDLGDVRPSSNLRIARGGTSATDAFFTISGAAGSSLSALMTTSGDWTITPWRQTLSDNQLGAYFSVNSLRGPMPDGYKIAAPIQPTNTAFNVFDQDNNPIFVTQGVFGAGDYGGDLNFTFGIPTLQTLYGPQTVTITWTITM